MNINRLIKEEIDKFLLEMTEEHDYASAASYIFCRDENGEWCVLAGRRGSTAPSCPNMFNMPVGMRDYDDSSAAECARRECMEETGLNIPIGKFQLVDYEEWSRGKFGANFVVKLDGTTSDYRIGNGDGENDRFHWIPLSRINEFPWAFNMGKNIIPKFKSV